MLFSMQHWAFSDVRVGRILTKVSDSSSEHGTVTFVCVFVLQYNKSKTIADRVTKHDAHDDLKEPWMGLVWGPKCQ